MITNLQAVHFARASEHHYSPTQFRTWKWDGKLIATLVKNGGGQSFFEADSGQATCAIRLSIALYLAGATFTPIPNSWWFDDPRTRPDDARKKAWQDVLLPSKASDYRDKLKTGKTEIKGTAEAQKKALAGKKGILFFETDGASGHVTLWNGSDTTFGAGAGDAYFSDKSAYFWGLSL